MGSPRLYQCSVGCLAFLLLVGAITFLAISLTSSTTCGFRWSVESAYLSDVDGGSGVGVDDLGYGIRQIGQLRQNEYTSSVLTASALIIYSIGMIVTVWGGKVDDKSETATSVYGDTIKQIRDRFTVSHWIIWGIVFPIHFATCSFASGIRDPWHVAALAVLGGINLHYLQSHNEALHSVSSLLYDDQTQPLTGDELDSRLISIERVMGTNEAYVCATIILVFLGADWFVHLWQNTRADGFESCAEWIPIGTFVVYTLLHIIIYFVTNAASPGLKPFDRQAPFLVAAVLIFGGTAALQMTCASAQACPNAAAS